MDTCTAFAAFAAAVQQLAFLGAVQLLACPEADQPPACSEPVQQLAWAVVVQLASARSWQNGRPGPAVGPADVAAASWDSSCLEVAVDQALAAWAFAFGLAEPAQLAADEDSSSSFGLAVAVAADKDCTFVAAGSFAGPFVEERLAAASFVDSAVAACLAVVVEWLAEAACLGPSAADQLGPCQYAAAGSSFPSGSAAVVGKDCTSADLAPAVGAAVAALDPSYPAEWASWAAADIVED